MHTPTPLLRSVRFPVALLLCCLLALPASAVPYLLNYQGRVAVGGQNHDGPGYFKFALIDGGRNQNRTATATASVSGTNRISGITITDGGSGYTSPPAVTITGTGTGAVAVATISGGAVTAITVEPAGGGYAAVPPPVVTIAPPPEDLQVATLWTNDGTRLGLGEKEPVDWLELPVTRGLYALQLGDRQNAGMPELSAKHFAQSDDLRLRVWFSPDRQTFTQLTPDQRIAAVGYAMMAEDVKDGSITSAKLAPGAVQMTQLAPEIQQQLAALLAWQATQVPVVTNANTFAVAQDNFTQWQIVATGSPSTYTASGLPAGLTLIAGTGLISGTPSAAGTFAVSLNATNNAGPGVPKNVTLTVHGPIHADYAAGVDTNAGTPTAPVKTLQHAIALAAAQSPKRSVRVSTAQQIVPQMITLPEGVSLYGGYTTGATWTRTATRTQWSRTNPQAGQDVIAVKATGIAATTVVDQFRISTQDVLAGAAGKSSIGMWMENCTGLALSNNEFVARNAMTGPSGAPGGNGAVGTNGADGQNGGIGNNGGTGAGNNTFPLLSNRGGHGGRLDPSGFVETAPTAGSSTGPGHGAGGAAGLNGEQGGAAATAGQNGGSVSGAAEAGTHGASTLAVGLIAAEGFAAPTGLTGGIGAVGFDGGGGGGGGGFDPPAGYFSGGGGGAGGKAGKGGNGGAGGGGGGGSFALVCLGGQLRATGNLFTTGNGGAGATGGTGGLGGAGGQGGNGGNGVNNAGANDSADGGDGGDGNAGGPGGGGSGGNGGPSAGIVLAGGAVVTTNTGSTFTLGNGGAGGLGGLRGGSASNRAASGNAGAATNILTLP